MTMPVKLYLDVGNTRVKWRCVAENAVTDGAVEYKQDVPNDTIVDIDIPQRPSDIWMSCVAGKKIADTVVDFCLRKWDKTVNLAEVGKCWGNIVNGYTIPHTLGVDRWLALIAVYQPRNANAIVIDAGTVISCDLLLNSGEFSGGMLIPGLKILSQVFENRVPHLGSINDFTGTFPGTSTKQAISLGVSMSTFASINEFIKQSSDQCGSQPKIFITGGDGDWLAARIDYPSVRCKNLVLDGLIKYAEK